MTGANQGSRVPALAEGPGAAYGHAGDIVTTSPAVAAIACAMRRRGSPHQSQTSYTHVLDVRDGAAGGRAFSQLGPKLRDRHLAEVDIVFSNAAARLTPQTPWSELIEPFVDTNNLGTTRMLRAVLPDPAACRAPARRGQRLRHAEQPAPTSLHDRFDTDTMSLDDVGTATMLAWRDAQYSRGRPAPRALARLDQHPVPRWVRSPPCWCSPGTAARPTSEPDTLIAAVCPGLIDTAARHALGSMT